MRRIMCFLEFNKYVPRVVWRGGDLFNGKYATDYVCKYCKEPLKNERANR